MFGVAFQSFAVRESAPGAFIMTLTVRSKVAAPIMMTRRFIVIRESSRNSLVPKIVSRVSQGMVSTRSRGPYDQPPHQIRQQARVTIVENISASASTANRRWGKCRQYRALR